MKHHIVPTHAPTTQEAEELGPRSCSQECMPPHTHRQEKDLNSLQALICQPSGQHRHPNRNRSPLSPRKGPDSNTNPSLKINESKGQQSNNANVRRKSCRQASRTNLALLLTKAPSVTSSSRFKSSLASGFGHLSKPQVHPRAAKTTRKPRDTVSERDWLLPDSWQPRLHSAKVGV